MRNGTLAAILALLSCGLGAGCDRRIDVDLNYAYEVRDYAWAEQLLEAGADINARFIQADGYSTLMMAARSESDPDGLRWLLDHGANVDLASFNGLTALHVAATGGRDEHVRVLLDAGADVNARTDRGQTALAAARTHGHAQIAELLVAAGGTE